MARVHQGQFYSVLLTTVISHVASVVGGESSSSSSSSYPCVGTATCVKKFMSQIWKQDTDFFPLNITDVTFRTNCTEAQACLTDTTGGGGTEIKDVITAGVSFIFDVCSQDRQQQFNTMFTSCIFDNGIRFATTKLQQSWLLERDSILADINQPKQMDKFCSFLMNYVASIQVILATKCTDPKSLTWCMQIIRENLYEKYGAFCLCIGNCDCKNKKSITIAPSSAVNRGGGTGAGYMMLVFGVFFIIGAFVVKKSRRRR